MHVILRSLAVAGAASAAMLEVVFRTGAAGQSKFSNPFTPQSFAGPAYPLSPSLGSRCALAPPAYVPTLPMSGTGRVFDLYVASTAQPLTFHVFVNSTAASMYLVVTDPDGQDVPTTVNWTLGWNTVTPPGASKVGNYTVEIGDGNKSTYFEVSAPSNVPFAVSNAYSAVGSPAIADPSGTSADTLSYFHVPPGTHDFGIFYNSSKVNVPVTVYDPNCVAHPLTAPYGRFTVDASAPSGVWAISRFYTDQVLLLDGVPNLISPSPAQVLTQAPSP